MKSSEEVKSGVLFHSIFGILGPSATARCFPSDFAICVRLDSGGGGAANSQSAFYVLGKKSCGEFQGKKSEIKKKTVFRFDFQIFKSAFKDFVFAGQKRQMYLQLMFQRFPGC